MNTQETIFEVVDNLPEKSVTTLMLQGLDTIIPGEWSHVHGFERMVTAVTGTTDPQQIAVLRERVQNVYTSNQNYARAVNLYRLVDKADIALGAAALANRLGERIQFLSLLHRLTPKADTTQALDLAVKLACEAVGFTMLKGLKHDNLKAFGDSLAEYGGVSLMRLTALVCVDGVIPLGPDFAATVNGLLKRSRPVALQESAVFKRVSPLIPGGDLNGQMKFVQGTLDAASGWTDRFVKSKGLTREAVINNLGKFIEISDEVLDYLGAFLDASTNYMEYTGVQTVARTLIEQAVSQSDSL